MSNHPSSVQDFYNRSASGQQYFVGLPTQRGYGLLSSITKFAIPLLQNVVKPAVKKYAVPLVKSAATHALKSGIKRIDNSYNRRRKNDRAVTSAKRRLMTTERQKGNRDNKRRKIRVEGDIFN